MGLEAGNILEVSWRGLSMGQRILMVQHFVFTGAGIADQTVPAATLALAEAFATTGTSPTMTNALRALMPTNYTLETLRVQRVWPERSVITEVAPNQLGLFAGTASVPNDTAAISWRTAKAGRNQVGVTKIGPLPTDAAVDGLVTNAYTGLLEALANAILTPEDIAAVGGTLFPVIWHAPGGTSDQKTTYVTKLEARTMRRRTVGRGE